MVDVRKEELISEKTIAQEESQIKIITTQEQNQSQSQ
jgi:hypothetical protein